MASVTVEAVWDILNVGDSDISEAKVLKMIKRAEVTLELELNVEIDYANCSDDWAAKCLVGGFFRRFLVMLNLQ